MSPRPRTLLIYALLVGILLAFGFWWHSARSQREAQAAVAQLQSATAVLTAELQREEQRLALAARTATGPATTTAVAVATVAAGASAPAPPPKPAINVAEIVAADPALQLLELRRQRGVMMQDFRDFFQDEHLSPTEIEAFTANWMQLSERTLDLRAAANAQDAAGKATVATLQKQAKADYDAAQLTLLGPERVARMQTHVQTSSLRSMAVKAAAGSAALAGVPLTPEQGRLLEGAAVAALGYEYVITTAGSSPDRAPALDWKALDEQARQILTPEQFHLFSSSEMRGRQTFEYALRRAKDAEFRAAQQTK